MIKCGLCKKQAKQAMSDMSSDPAWVVTYRWGLICPDCTKTIERSIVSSPHLEVMPKAAQDEWLAQDGAVPVAETYPELASEPRRVGDLTLDELRVFVLDVLRSEWRRSIARVRHPGFGTGETGVK